MSEEKILRRIFGSKRNEVAGAWRRLHNEEIHTLYASPNIIRVIKSRRVRWSEHSPWSTSHSCYEWRQAKSRKTIKGMLSWSQAKYTGRSCQNARRLYKWFPSGQPENEDTDRHQGRRRKLMEVKMNVLPPQKNIPQAATDKNNEFIDWGATLSFRSRISVLIGNLLTKHLPTLYEFETFNIRRPETLLNL
jgi:hypothetical protein